MIEIRNLTAGYGEKEVLHGVSLDLPLGQVTAILGPNGCGKSTLLKSVVGLADVTGGDILVDSGSYVNLTPAQLARHVAYLPQGRRLPEITVGRLVLHGRFPYLSYPRRYRPADHAMARAAMEQVGIAELADEPLRRLSGGTRQKAYIAMALAQDTPTILLDEPTTYLDIAHQLQLMELCRDLARRGKAVAMVVHDLPLALRYADRVAVLSRGTVLREGTPEEVYRSGALEQAFGVRVSRAETPAGVQYFCEKE